jgi:hypothetical protein
MKGLMRWFLWLAVLVILMAGIYGYRNNPTGCGKLATDLHADVPIIAADVIAVLTPTAASSITSTAADGTPAASVASGTGGAPAPAAPPAALPLPANSLIQNGDFSQGTAHWDGDGRNPLAGRGLVVTLNPSAWTRIYQTFTAGPGTRYSIVVNYRLSSYIFLSKNPADYTGINKQIQISGFENFGSFNSAPGQFYGTVGDPASAGVALEVYSPRLGSSDVQTYQHSYPPVPVSETKIFGLAFPPGSGSVVILGAAVTGE